ncbi:hypothetical protein Mal48_15400 [Thalassoglobus polymorphus]|uniref:Uncharacterized protein n=1 Tax=Thalassoglobus polymorphus TaxID=2527994 RepID=A0A517QL88_9PLAN|nr:hypothetical protein Mal48_15400 [Thalassoglobus polymorphus]
MTMGAKNLAATLRENAFRKDLLIAKLGIINL